MFRRGLAFMGHSPKYPYIGLGRGGLPRCAASLCRKDNKNSNEYKVDELEILKEEANVLTQRLNSIEDRITELQNNCNKS